MVCPVIYIFILPIPMFIVASRVQYVFLLEINLPRTNCQILCVLIWITFEGCVDGIVLVFNSIIFLNIKMHLVSFSWFRFHRKPKTWVKMYLLGFSRWHLCNFHRNKYYNHMNIIIEDQTKIKLKKNIWSFRNHSVYCHLTSCINNIS